MTLQDELRYGVEYPAGSGQWHYAYEMRLPTVADNIAAIEEHGVDSNMRLNTAMLARCLVKLGDIPAEAINYALVASLVDDDFDVLASTREQLKKKRLQQKASLSACALPSSPLASTASASSAPEN